jgi:hypothetical protein
MRAGSDLEADEFPQNPQANGHDDGGKSNHDQAGQHSPLDGFHATVVAKQTLEELLDHKQEYEPKLKSSQWPARGMSPAKAKRARFKR